MKETIEAIEQIIDLGHYSDKDRAQLIAHLQKLKQYAKLSQGFRQFNQEVDRHRDVLDEMINEVDQNIKKLEKDLS